jgi:hypothetical protein
LAAVAISEAAGRTVAGLGAADTFGGMEWFSPAARYSLLIIPFATSMVLVLARVGTVLLLTAFAWGMAPVDTAGPVSAAQVL